MVRKTWVVLVALCVARFSSVLCAQDYADGGYDGGGGGASGGSGSVGSNEQLYYYDDQEPWKHGYRQIMPYYHGWHSFRPYNYHHVFGQGQTASGWGLNQQMAYSQQWWHRYEGQSNLTTPTFSANDRYRMEQEFARVSAQRGLPQVPQYPATEVVELPSNGVENVLHSDAPALPFRYSPLQTQSYEREALRRHLQSPAPRRY